MKKIVLWRTSMMWHKIRNMSLSKAKNTCLMYFDLNVI